MSPDTPKPTAKAKRSAKHADISEDEERGVDSNETMPVHADVGINEGKGDSGDEDDEESQECYAATKGLGDKDRAVSTHLFPFLLNLATLKRN